ncbi:MAG: deoxyribodipyrimidine photo-lyase, partial [Candidatus Aminicenantes bacterium]
MIKKRVRKLNELAVRKDGPVVYWMSRDQRVAYNWALLVAQELAQTYHKPHCVVFCLIPEFL